MSYENGYERKKGYWYNGKRFKTEAEMLEFREFCEHFAADCSMWEETFNRDCPYDPADCPKKHRGY